MRVLGLPPQPTEEGTLLEHVDRRQTTLTQSITNHEPNPFSKGHLDHVTTLHSMLSDARLGPLGVRANFDTDGAVTAFRLDRVELPKIYSRASAESMARC